MSAVTWDIYVITRIRKPATYIACSAVIFITTATCGLGIIFFVIVITFLEMLYNYQILHRIRSTDDADYTMSVTRTDNILRLFIYKISRMKLYFSKHHLGC